jgi:hypothetical protein
MLHAVFASRRAAPPAVGQPITPFRGLMNVAASGFIGRCPMLLISGFQPLGIKNK